MRNNRSEIFDAYANVQLVFDRKTVKVRRINGHRRLKGLFQRFYYQPSAAVGDTAIDLDLTVALHDSLRVACKSSPAILRVYVQLLRFRPKVLHKVPQHISGDTPCVLSSCLVE